MLSRFIGSLQIRGIKTNIPFMENVLRHPVFLAGAATTGFIETQSKELFKFEGHSNIRANKLLLYLADMVSSEDQQQQQRRQHQQRQQQQWQYQQPTKVLVSTTSPAAPVAACNWQTW
jgi:pyruvate carboxylase